VKPSPKAIILGGITDVVLSVILGIPFTIYVINKLDQGNLPPEKLSAEVTTAIHQSVGLHALQLLIGFGCSVIGGYIAARLAVKDKFQNAALASWLCVGIGIYALVLGKGAVTVPMHILLIALTPVCYLVGAYLYRRGSKEDA
jgi:hypothetical protein